LWYNVQGYVHEVAVLPFYFLAWYCLVQYIQQQKVKWLYALLIVLIAAKLGPIDAVNLAIKNPAEYERILKSVHHEIAAFGGTFLLMVGMRYFFDIEKDVHWIKVIEKPLAKYGKLYLVEAMLVMLMLIICTYKMKIDLTPLPNGELINEFEKRLTFLASGLAGLIVYALVQWVEILLEGTENHDAVNLTAKSGLGGFLYLEVLDASFSFDGVIGAFALTNNIFIIALGLGIGAMFVRSMTVMLVEKGTISQYKYLEHGAFWAIIALGGFMFIGLFYHINEVIVGVVGAVFIGISIVSSIKANKNSGN